MAEERDNIILVWWCLPRMYQKRDIFITEGYHHHHHHHHHHRVFSLLVTVIYYLKNRQEMKKLVNVGL